MVKAHEAKFIFSFLLFPVALLRSCCMNEATHPCNTCHVLGVYYIQVELSRDHCTVVVLCWGKTPKSLLTPPQWPWLWIKWPMPRSPLKSNLVVVCFFRLSYAGIWIMQICLHCGDSNTIYKFIGMCCRLSAPCRFRVFKLIRISRKWLYRWVTLNPNRTKQTGAFPIDGIFKFSTQNNTVEIEICVLSFEKKKHSN